MEYETKAGRPIVYCVFREKELIALFSYMQAAREFLIQVKSKYSKAKFYIYTRIPDYYVVNEYYGTGD